MPWRMAIRTRSSRIAEGHRCDGKLLAAQSFVGDLRPGKIYFALLKLWLSHARL
jgi:hypothetical protein